MSFHPSFITSPANTSPHSSSKQPSAVLLPFPPPLSAPTHITTNVPLSGKAPDIGDAPDIPTLRAYIAAAEATAPPPPPCPADVIETDHTIPVRDGSTIKVRVHAPRTPPSSGSPLCVIYHGGGFCIGEPSNEEGLCRQLAQRYGVVSVNVDYRLAPEWKYPTALHDSYDATEWVSLTIPLSYLNKQKQ